MEIKGHRQGYGEQDSSRWGDQPAQGEGEGFEASSPTVYAVSQLESAEDAHAAQQAKQLGKAEHTQHAEDLKALERGVSACKGDHVEDGDESRDHVKEKPEDEGKEEGLRVWRG